MMKMVYVPAKTIFFYINGDKNEIKRLMFNVVSLGKKTSYGFGRIKSMSIKTIDKDYSLIKDNKAMRPIPTSMLRYAETKMLMAYKPPYWSKNNVDMCAFPNTGVKIG
jgi:CRISPR type IV-associated protein Csf3